MTDHPRDPVRTLSADSASGVVEVLSDAFRDYPVMRFVLGTKGDYSAGLNTLVTFFVMARVLREEPMIGMHGPAGLVAAAILSDPNDRSSPPELSVVRERTWETLGPEARERYEAFGRATAAFSVDTPHIHLNMIGVRTDHTGRGFGRALLEAVHARSAADPTSTGVSLTTEAPENVDLYRHFGYRVTGEGAIGSAFRSWGMFRPDP